MWHVVSPEQKLAITNNTGADVVKHGLLSFYRMVLSPALKCMLMQ